MNSETHFQPSFPVLFSSQPLWLERLRKGIWPKSLVTWIVAFYMAIFIFRPWEKLVPELGSLRFERVMVLFVVAAVVLLRGVFVKVNIQNASMLGLLFAVWISGRHAVNTQLSSIQVVEFCGLVISFFVIQKAVKTPYQLFFIIACYFVATSLYVFKSEWEYIFHDAARYEMGVKRLQGLDLTHGHPNTFGNTMLCSLPIALFFYRIRGTFCRTWPAIMRKSFTWLIRLYGCAAVGGVILTRSRASCLGLIVFAGLLVLQKQGMITKLKWSIGFALCAIAAFFLAPEDIRYRIQSTWDASVEYQHDMGGANSSAAGRIQGLFASIEIFRRFPVTGVGIGNFASYREEFVDFVGLDAHNLPGEVMAEMGVVGCIAFAIFFFALVANLLKLRQYGQSFTQVTGNPIYQLLSFAMLDALVMLMYGGLSCHNFQSYQWYWFAAFAALAVPIARRELSRVREDADYFHAELENEELAERSLAS